MAKTYEPIATTTLGSAAATYTFSSIPSTYTDLVVVMQPKGTTSFDSKIYFNGDVTSGLYSDTVLYGTGTTAGSTRETAKNFITLSWYASTSADFNNSTIIHIMNYSNATTFKTALVRANNAASGVDAIVGLWRNTAAITSVTLNAPSNTYATGSTFTLYGIKAA